MLFQRRRALIVTCGVALAIATAIGLTMGDISNQENSRIATQPVDDAGHRSEANEDADATLSQGQSVAKAYKLGEEGAQLVDIGGTQIPISFRKREPLDPMPTTLDEYNALRARAEAGDSMAAFVLHRALEVCEMAYSSKKQLEEAIEVLHQQHILKTADMPVGAHLTDTSLLKELEQEHYRAPFERCQYIPLSHKEETEGWLQTSAELGYSEAQMKRGREIFGTAESLSMLEQAWQAGDIFAADWLAKGYAEGTLDGAIRPDPISAYAYFYTFSRLVGNAGGPKFQSWINARAASFTNSLSAVEQAQAIDIAKELVASSDGCCLTSMLMGE